MKYFKKYFNEAILLLILLASIGSLLKGCNIAESIIYRIDDNYIKYEQKLNSLNKTTVYITSYGERYHRFYHYKNRNYSMPFGDCLLEGYTPCMVCNPVKVKFEKYNARILLIFFVLVTWFSGFFILFNSFMIQSQGLTKTYSLFKIILIFFINWLSIRFRSAV